jgi:hypothetical protein
VPVALLLASAVPLAGLASGQLWGGWSGTRALLWGCGVAGVGWVRNAAPRPAGPRPA